MQETTIEFLSDPAKPVSLRDSLSPDPWPAVNGARALTREERALLELVPWEAQVHCADMVLPYAGGLWQKRVRDAIEHRRATIRQDGECIVVDGLPAGRQWVDLLVAPYEGAGAADAVRASAVSRVAASRLPARPASFFRTKHLTGGHGYVARGCKDN